MNFKNEIPDLANNGTIKSDGNGKGEAFNIFFKSIFTKESDCLTDLNLDVKSSIEHASFQTDKIKKKLDNLNPYKSPGADELLSIMLKELSNELSLPFFLIFTKSFNEGELPQD